MLRKEKTMDTTTTRIELQERRNAPLILPSSRESFNLTSLETPLTKRKDSKLCSHSLSGYNLRMQSRLSAHKIFVLGFDGKPLTPTTPARAKKLLKSKQAVPVWNKFSQFGIRMLVETRKETPETVLGVDFGTKFEGYTLVSGKENSLAVMWKLPDKKKLVAKLEERKALRRARRWRTCRRRECRSDNRSKKGFIAPSQMMVILSRIKVMNEFFKCYPVDTVALEDVCFNHRDNRWGKNFSTIEVGKHFINNWIRARSGLQFFQGYDTEACRELYGYKKSRDKSAEVFNSHCSDALAIATDISAQTHIEQGNLLIVDDTYRSVRRRLHDSQFSKGGVREKYSAGNFKEVKKGTVCEHGQIVGGTKKSFFIRNQENKRIGRTNIDWLSHNFKNYEVKSGNSSLQQDCSVSLPPTI
jgi:hypothetical protein